MVFDFEIIPFKQVHGEMLQVLHSVLLPNSESSSLGVEPDLICFVDMLHFILCVLIPSSVLLNIHSCEVREAIEIPSSRRAFRTELEKAHYFVWKPVEVNEHVLLLLHVNIRLFVDICFEQEQRIGWIGQSNHVGGSVVCSFRLNFDFEQSVCFFDEILADFGLSNFSQNFEPAPLIWLESKRLAFLNQGEPPVFNGTESGSKIGHSVASCSSSLRRPESSRSW